MEARIRWFESDAWHSVLPEDQCSCCFLSLLQSAAWDFLLIRNPLKVVFSEEICLTDSIRKSFKDFMLFLFGHYFSFSKKVATHFISSFQEKYGSSEGEDLWFWLLSPAHINCNMYCYRNLGWENPSLKQASETVENPSSL